MATFGNKNALQQAVILRLGSYPEADRLGFELAGEFAYLEEPETKYDPLGMGRRMVVARVRWAIRDDDLALVQLVGHGATVLAASSLFAEKPVAALVALCTSVAKGVRAAFRKGARLSGSQTAILIALKGEYAQWTVEEIAETLAFEQEDVLQDLRSLQRVVLADGSEAAFAACDNDGRWRAVGV